jgi:hypothetical protein
VRALVAWSEGRHAEAAAVLTGLQPILAEAGGSSVQLEVFKHVEREARRHLPAQDRAHLPLAAANDPAISAGSTGSTCAA